MRYKLPDGCAGVTLAGLELAAGEDRTIEAEAVASADLAPHGIVPAESDKPASSLSNDHRMLR